MSDQHGKWCAEMLSRINVTVANLTKPRRPDLMNDLPFTPRAKQAAIHAQKIATAAGHAYIGAQHLFLALLEQDTVEKLIVAAGLTPDSLKTKLMHAFKEDNAPKPDAPPADQIDMVAMLRRAADILEKQKTAM